MANPSGTIQRPDIGMAFGEYAFDAETQGFVGMRLCPPLPVKLASANFSKLELKSLLRQINDLRDRNAGYPTRTYEFTQDNFKTDERGIEEPFDDRERTIFAYTGIEFDVLSAARSRDGVMRNQEQRIADLLQDTGTFGNEAVADGWKDYANCDPVANVLDGISSFKAASGFNPNVVVINDNQLRDLQRCDAILDQIKFSGKDDPKKVLPLALAALWHVDEVIVANTWKNTADAGKTASLSPVWDNAKVGIYRVAKTRDFMEPCVARSFVFVEEAGEEGVVEQYRDEKIRGDRVRFRIDVVEKVLYAPLGYILTGIDQTT